MCSGAVECPCVGGQESKGPPIGNMFVQEDIHSSYLEKH